MNLVYHPEFPRDVKRYRDKYAAISTRLGSRFSEEIVQTLDLIRSHPTSEGHFVNTGSVVKIEFRRANLRSFPFFILYGIEADRVIVGSLIPAKSAPLTWLRRFGK